MDYYPALNDLTQRYPQLSNIENDISAAAESLINCFSNGGMLLVCGNGGSSADSEHIAAEFMKGFEHKRPLPPDLKEKLGSIGGARGKYLAEKLQEGLPAISLTSNNALVTAIANDLDPYLIYAQQVAGYGVEGDVLMALSTSGNSGNVIDAIITAKAKGLTVIGLTGETGGKMGKLCDILIKVPSADTALAQEMHLPVFHTICRIVENEMFGNKTQES